MSEARSALLGAGLGAIFVALALLHLYWAAGGQRAAQGGVPARDGRPLFVPGPFACAVVALALLAAALITAQRAGLAPLLGLPAWVPRLGIWVIATLFGARAVGEFTYVGFFKRERDSVFARRDTWIYSPLCVVIAVLAAALARLGPR